MPKINKRTLWGYAPAAVDEAVRALQAEHAEKVASLTAQLAELERTNQTLRTEVAAMRDDFLEQPDHEGEIAAMLLQAHLEQSEAVYRVYQELQEVEQKQGEVLEISEMHREAVKTQVLDKLRHLETTIEQQSKEGEHGRQPL